MNWFANIFSTGAAKVIDSLGSAIDKVVTSDQERMELKNKLEMEMNNFRSDQMAAMAAYDREITKRHVSDMKADSWLSKNIRPMTLAFMTVTVMGLAWATIFKLEPEQAILVTPWTNLFSILLGTIYAFYFGSRGFEKVQGIKSRS